MSFPCFKALLLYFHLFHVSLGLFLVELLLNCYKIVISSTLNLYFLLPFVSRLMRRFSCRTVAKLLYNCTFLYFKALVLCSICLTSHDVHFFRTLARFFSKLFFPLKINFFLQFVSRIMWSISCRTVAILFLSCAFLYYKDLLLSFIYIVSHEVYFL